MDTTTSNSPRKTGKPPATSTVRPQHTSAARLAEASTARPRPVRGEHAVAVSFDAWGPQGKAVHASGGGGRGDAPYVAVTVGGCLTYAYDRAALGAHLRAWRRAAELNRGLRLPEQPAPDAPRGGQDVALLTNASGPLRYTAHGGVEPGGPVLTVIVGAVTVRVHTTSALASYLAAWTQAEALAGILDDPEPVTGTGAPVGKRGRR